MAFRDVFQQTQIGFIENETSLPRALLPGELSNGTTNGQEITAAFTNVKDGEIDTGVILDNAPYILMLAVVAGGAMMLVIKKRREEE